MGVQSTPIARKRDREQLASAHLPPQKNVILSKAKDPYRTGHPPPDPVPFLPHTGVQSTPIARKREREGAAGFSR
jgi:hypothetical protein